ncbi:MAG: LysR family transcriptional regulator, partial [Oscillospiraceae bacterium]|nr:LysR family transcriptional regulator [Oscillospiraceae bacterium]
MPAPLGRSGGGELLWRFYGEEEFCLNIQQLKYFVEVCKCKSFSKAAKSLYISQQGISMAIMRLESEFSAKLFIRTSKGLMLTADGEYLLGCAETILAEFEKCEDYFHKKPPMEA